MPTKILEDMKQELLGCAEDPSFDNELTMHLNSRFVALQQLGIGPSAAFQITTGNETWDDFVTDTNLQSLSRTYLWGNLKLVFDPPKNSNAKEAIQRLVDESEWRLIHQEEVLNQNGE